MHAPEFALWSEHKSSTTSAQTLIAALVQILPSTIKKKLAKGLYLYKNEGILKIMSFILCFHYSAHVANWLENFAVDTTKSLSSHQSLSSGKKAG